MTLPGLRLSRLGRRKGPGQASGRAEPPEEGNQAVQICSWEREGSLSPENGVGFMTDLNGRFSQERTQFLRYCSHG